jgi:hypothetical protein
MLHAVLGAMSFQISPKRKDLTARFLNPSLPLMVAYYWYMYLVADSCRQPQTYVQPEAAINSFWGPDDERCVAWNMLSN